MEPQDIERTAATYTEAWNSGSAEAVAAFHAEKSQIVINDGEPWTGRSGVGDMARGFFADVPDLSLRCDGLRAAGTHAVYLWTFVGHHAQTRKPLKISGWEEWTFGGDGKLIASRGWFDAADYERQVEGC